MTLDEAIRHEKDMCRTYGVGQEEHIRLAAWLTELRDLRAAIRPSDPAEGDHAPCEDPVDADGEPIRVGDVIDAPHVTAGTVVDVGGGYAWVRCDDSETMTRIGCEYDKCHRHHGQTVEDVLREFAEAMRCQNEDFGEMIVAGYAKKLQIKGE